MLPMTTDVPPRTDAVAELEVTQELGFVPQKFEMRSSLANVRMARRLL